VYGLDTEFHGERTYRPRLALVQCAWPGGCALVDPLAVDITPLAEVLRGPGTMVTHAGEQDLGILEHATGARPSRLFDTQIAAGFVGLGQPGLAELVRRVLDHRLPKGHQLTDWTRRPLDERQREYAASDVVHLLDLYRELSGRLEDAGRLSWALDECEALRVRDRTARDPDTAWWRIKGSRRFRGEARGVAQEVAAWRERTASERDLPPRFVLSDLALAGVVQRKPRTEEELGHVRGLDRGLKPGAARSILAAVATGRELPDSALRKPPDGDEVDGSLAPAITVALAWCQQRAGELDLYAPLLATRADVAAFIGARRGPLAHGWRHEAVATELEELLDGRASLTLADGGRRLDLTRA